MGLLLLVAGCGDTTTDERGAGGSGNGGTQSGGPGGTASAGKAGAPTNEDPTLCGGAYSPECAVGKICRFDSGCGTVGHCTRITDSCDDNYEPVCGCDGKTYSNECYARAAGVSQGTPGECGATFECGPYHCGPDQYCLDKADDAKGPWRFACVDLPGACGDQATCECLTGVKSCYVRFTCATVSGGVMLTCE